MSATSSVFRRLLPLGFLVAAGCAAEPEETGWIELPVEAAAGGNVERLVGTVRKLEVEGGVEVIETPDGEQLVPINLPRSLAAEPGISIEAELRRRPDLVSYTMAGPLVELLRVRVLSPEEAPDDTGARLLGTRWLLEDLAGTGVIDRSRATLEFPAPNRLAGLASCNRYNGSVAFDGERIDIGRLTLTDRDCVEALERQEARYLEALRNAARLERAGPFLLLWADGFDAPLRYTELPAESGERIAPEGAALRSA
jgi:heat shock protein HslJ